MEDKKNIALIIKYYLQFINNVEALKGIETLLGDLQSDTLREILEDLDIDF